MPKRSYYAILGVSECEEPQAIRAAYRELARRLHPDVSGGATADEFRQVTEAYRVLSDPEQRRDYDLLRGQPRRLAQDPRDCPARDMATRAYAWDPISVLGEPERVGPSYDALIERLIRNFTGVGSAKAERPESLSFELLLTRDEAASGCVVPIGVPAFQRCGGCSGRGYRGLLLCPDCQAEGVVQVERLLRVHVPPGVPSGAILERSLEGLGISNLYLRIQVLVEP